ncbi:MAG: tRNA (N(6)-L-threonylcarbamoyladenosine(37)-C(2))-methylthiotransferase MtaB [Lachnospiraceae bacterium]
MKKVALHNLGCKVNAYETEAMQELLEKNQYEIVPFREGADIYIINTCTVTNIADRKSRQMLHRARKMNPNAIVIAAGCYVQTKEKQAQVDDCIDIVIGNNKKQDLISILADFQHKGGNQQGKTASITTELIDINHTNEYENLHVSRTAEHTRAYLKVQDGCNQFCTYCIIPFARGRVRSRKKSDVIEEVKNLVKNGYQEVVLTGIHLSSYGVDFEQKEDLLSLIQSVHEIEGLKRIRLGSLEPRIITTDFVKAISNLDKLCPHFHLSLQSGCDATLKRMNRRYTSAEYFDACTLIRDYFIHPALTTDIIVGFPGETEEEFLQSKAFVEKVGFYETHIFKYSKREGTKAAVMEEQVADYLKLNRSNQMLELNEQKREEFEQFFIQKEVEILLEEQVEIRDQAYFTGHTKEYLRVAVPIENYRQNQIIKIKIDNHSQIIH